MAEEIYYHMQGVSGDKTGGKSVFTEIWTPLVSVVELQIDIYRAHILLKFSNSQRITTATGGLTTQSRKIWPASCRCVTP